MRFMLGLVCLQATGAVTVFTNVQVIPMDRERILAHQSVVVRDGQIVEIGPSMRLKAPLEAVVIAGEGRFLIPGLIDMHVHLGEDDFFLFLANGVTTVRNMGGMPQHIAWRDAIRRGEMEGPDIFTTGPMITGGPLRFQAKVIVKSGEESAATVADQKRAGYDFVKAYEGLTPETYAALVSAAKRAGLRVVGHIPESVGLKGVLDAGQSSIEHFEQLIYKEFAPNLDPARLPAVARELARTGTWVCPTIAFFEKGALPAADAWARPEMSYVPQETLSWWKAGQGGYPSFNQMMIWFNGKMLRSFHDSGVKLLAGTDTPNPRLVPGFSMVDELRALVHAGLTPYEAIEASTRSAADFLNGSFGTIETGKRADLLLVEQNPLADVANLEKPEGVMVRGRWYSRANLDQKLEALAAKYGRK